MKRIPQIILLLTSGFILTACAQQGEKTSMNVTELKEKLNDENLIVLDVRTEEELDGPLGHIEGIVHIPLQELRERINELEPYSDKQIAVICRSGNRSNTATGFLRQNGFDAYNVEGGMIDWRNKIKD